MQYSDFQILTNCTHRCVGSALAFSTLICLGLAISIVIILDLQLRRSLQHEHRHPA